MYEDYLDDPFDDNLDTYRLQLSDLAEEMSDARMNFQMEMNEIDEYWDRENEYIKNSGIYTKAEIREILAQHEEIRRSKKRDVIERYGTEKDMLDFEKEQLEFELEQEMMDQEFEREERELALQELEQEDAMNARIIAARNEEQAAYDDFIASLDMND